MALDPGCIICQLDDAGRHDSSCAVQGEITVGEASVDELPVVITGAQFWYKPYNQDGEDGQNELHAGSGHGWSRFVFSRSRNVEIYSLLGHPVPAGDTTQSAGTSPAQQIKQNYGNSSGHDMERVGGLPGLAYGINDTWVQGIQQRLYHLSARH